MPKGSKKKSGSSRKVNAPRPAHAHRKVFRAIRHKVKSTRAKVKERVVAGIEANRKVGSSIRRRALDLRDRLEAEARRKLEIERTLAEKDQELKELEMRLLSLDKAETQKCTDKSGKNKRVSGATLHEDPVNIYTSNDKHQKEQRASGAADAQDIKGYKDLLERRLQAEDEEMSLVQEQLAQLEQRQKALDRREDKLKAVEKSLQDGACSPELDNDIKEMRSGLEERLSILEQRSRKLDMLEAELAKMESFVDTQKKGLGRRSGPKRPAGRRGKGPSVKARPPRKRGSEEE